MILLLVGAVCFLAAVRAAAREPVEDVRPGGAAAWYGLVALLTLTQLWLGRGELEHWRFTLLGLRYQVAGAGGRGLPVDLTVSGDEAAADVWVPGAGDAPAASLRPVGEDTLLGVAVHPAEDAGAVVLVEERRLLGSDWRVLGATPLLPGDTVDVRGAGALRRLVVGRVRGSARFFDARLPLPWVRDVAIRAADGPDGGPAAVLPAPEGSLLSRLRGRRPSVFQRTYPLSDVLSTLGELTGEPSGEGAAPLGSFLYYRDGVLHLADLDAEVSVTGVEGDGGVTVWSPEQGGRRILVAGLPHRDYPEPDLTLPERYGVRPLRSFGVGVDRGWLDLALGAPEIRSLDRETLGRLGLPGVRDARGRPVHGVRLASGRNSLARQAIVFDAVPRSLAVAIQAVFRLPEDPRAGEIAILAPSGLATWRTGRPLALGTGDRRVLLRVDGQGSSAGFWLVHGALLAMLGLVFLRRPMTGPVFALALTLTGMACLRLVLGLTVVVGFPWVQESQQIGLWALVLVPWAVVVAGEAGRAGADPGLTAPGAWRRWGFHAGYALGVVAVAVVLFGGQPAKQAVLSAVPLAVFLLWVAARAGPAALRRGGVGRPWDGLTTRIEEAARRRPRLWSGWAAGLVLLLARGFMESLGWREQITLGGTRVGVSVLYTPVAVAVVAVVLHLHGRRVRAAAAEGRLPAAVAGALLDVGLFLGLAFVGVSAWISDFGMALVLLPGCVVLLALLGFRWSAGAPASQARTAAAVLALPLALFVLLQAAPPLLHFAWGGDVGPAEARMEEWNRNELLLLERGDPAALRMIGQRRSEALAVMRETMRSYTRGNILGKGFLEGRVNDELADTATREHAVSALLASQFGLPGVAGLVLLLVSLLPPVSTGMGGGRRAPAAGAGGSPGPVVLALGGAVAVLVVVARVLPPPFNTLLVGLLLLGAAVVALGPRFGAMAGWWGRGGEVAGGAAGIRPAPGEGLRRLVAAVSLYVVCFAGLYMVFANYGLVFFTGKNAYLLGLDSVGDALETVVLAGMAALALGAEGSPAGVGAGPTAVAAPAEAGDGGAWWRP